jgi:hypothetical protein
MNKGTVTPKTKYNKKDTHGNINEFFRKKGNIFKDVGNLMQKQIPENLSFSNLT